jgi:hypothetical protein
MMKKIWWILVIFTILTGCAAFPAGRADYRDFAPCHEDCHPMCDAQHLTDCP